MLCLGVRIRAGYFFQGSFAKEALVAEGPLVCRELEANGKVSCAESFAKEPYFRRAL